MRGIIILSALILILFGIRIYIACRDNKIHLGFSKTESNILGTDQNFKLKNELNKKNTYKEHDIKLVQFDPNKARYSELVNLGLGIPMVRNIIKYRQNGGSFKHPDDLLKIYGMDPVLYKRLQPYIFIEKETATKVQQNRQVNSRAGTIIDINKADTAELKQIPGIGSVLSKRIIKYRQLLGGFVNTNQLNEVYGINDSLLSTFKYYLLSDTNMLVRININTCTLHDLDKHPYISHYQAKAIESYRKLAGPFKDKKQLLENYLFSEEDYLKIAPYLTLN